MHTPSIRMLAALAYERGEEFDPGALPTPALLEHLSKAATASPIVAADVASERRHDKPKSHSVAIPDWFSACDLVDRPIAARRVAVIHGEPF
jgi:hypothetical protein